MTSTAERMFKHIASDGRAKFKYHSESKAVMGAVTMQAQLGGYFDVYRCRECGYWHVGRRRDRL